MGETARRIILFSVFYFESRGLAGRRLDFLFVRLSGRVDSISFVRFGVFLYFLNNILVVFVSYLDKREFEGVLEIGRSKFIYRYDGWVWF